MKTSELVEKLVVRAKCIEERSGTGLAAAAFGSHYQDASYTTEPIFIEAVENGVTYYRGEPNGEVRILSARFNDDHWVPVSERFTPKKWMKDDGKLTDAGSA